MDFDEQLYVLLLAMKKNQFFIYAVKYFDQELTYGWSYRNGGYLIFLFYHLSSLSIWEIELY